ncbi:MAG: acetyl-CoA carboxylase, carboxyl transferase, beta subunit [Caloramator sp.]|jgi:acetyl-CoA carboxylase carboxyl transferase subunit beta|nr:acetyl-CoA carboxylase, carboxyl transferase, beta subunit [Caloramator sp.]
MIDNMFDRKKEIIYDNLSAKVDIPDGLWIKCDRCKKIIYKDDLISSLYVCTSCGYHFRITAPQRIEMLCDEGSFEEIDRDLVGDDPLNFPGYKEKLSKLREETGLKEAVVTGIGRIEGLEVALGVMDNRFLMGSMGYAVGEKITRLVYRSIEKRIPLIIFTTSGGARMQEGIVSLMQMAKTSAALAKHNKEGLLYISYLTDPTTGGVSASFAMLGDIILAEPGALIGFAGPRVIEQTIRQRLPEGFQTSEFLLKHGFVDRVVDRRDMKSMLNSILRMHLGVR